MKTIGSSRKRSILQHVYRHEERAHSERRVRGLTLLRNVEIYCLVMQQGWSTLRTREHLAGSQYGNKNKADSFHFESRDKPKSENDSVSIILNFIFAVPPKDSCSKENQF